MLRVKSRTVDTYVRERSLPVFRVGRSPLFLRDAVVEWVRAQPDLEAGERPPAFGDLCEWSGGGKGLSASKNAR